MAAGSSLWQTIFICFAFALIAIEIVRGWRLGVVRQLVRVVAVAAAYASAIFGGPWLLPLVRPFVKVPDIVISVVVGAVLALLVYCAIVTIGSILFKRTGQQRSGILRLLYGLSGALVGLFFGLLTIWLTVVAVRSLGAIANAQLHAQAAQESARKQQIAPRRIYPDRRLPADAEPRFQPLVASLAKLKNSIELGTIGNAVKTADVVPPGTYETLGKLGQVLSNRQSAERFLYYPGAKELTENPKIVALRNDPEIIQMIEEQRFLDLLQDKRLIDAVNDPALAAQVRSFDFQKALDYAMKR